jgi:hypothetical protein
MSLFLFVFVVVAVIIAIWIFIQLLTGVAILSVFAYWVLKGLGKLLGIALIQKPVYEIIGEPLTDEFKTTLAPDIWTDGRRMYFDFGEKSYSLATDLEGARRRKNQLFAEATTTRAKALDE